MAERINGRQVDYQREAVTQRIIQQHGDQQALIGNVINVTMTYDNAFNATTIHDAHWGKRQYLYNANQQISQIQLYPNAHYFENKN